VVSYLSDTRQNAKNKIMFYKNQNCKVITSTITPSQSKEINQGKIKQYFCGQSVTSQLLLSVFTEVLQLSYNSATMIVCNNHTVMWKLHISSTKWGPRVSLDTLELHHTSTCLQF